MLYQVQYTKIGLGFISVLGIIMFFLFWLHKSNYDQCKMVYDVHFPYTVSGLRKGDPVAYNGVNAGRVKDIFVNPKDIERVIVRVCLLPGFPIKTDAYAVVEVKNIAGGAIIALHGGSNEAPLLKPKKRGQIPVICSQKSRIDQVMEAAPRIVVQVQTLLNDFGELFRGPQKKQWIDSLRLLNSNLAKLEKIQELLFSIVEHNQGPLNNLLGHNTGHVQKFFKNGAEAMSAVKKVVEHIERSPGRFFRQDPGAGTVLR
jgi:ABC-type transporter Mla subunit MlaD